MITHQEARKELKQILLSKIDVLYDYITQQEKKRRIKKMIEKIFNANKKKFYELYRDTSSWEEFDAYLRNLPKFKVMEFITEDESKLLYTLAKGE